MKKINELKGDISNVREIIEETVKKVDEIHALIFTIPKEDTINEISKITQINPSFKPYLDSLTQFYEINKIQENYNESNELLLSLDTGLKQRIQNINKTRDFYERRQIQQIKLLIHQNLAVNYYYTDEIDKSLKYQNFAFYEGIEVGCSNEMLSGFLNNIAWLLFKSGQIDISIITFKNALKLNPANVEAHNNLGLVCETIGQIDAAILNYKNAIKFNPKAAIPYNNLGNILQKLGLINDAERNFRKAIELYPNYADAHDNLGVVLLRQSRYGEAEREFRISIEINPTFVPPYSNFGVLLRKLERYDEAIEVLTKAIEIKQDYKEAWNNLGNVYWELKEFENAIRCYDTALKIDPNYTDARTNLTNLKKSRG